MKSEHGGHGGAGPAAPGDQGHPLDNNEGQNHAGRLGMWVFLGTQGLLFAGLFLAYTVYRWLYHPAFRLASRELSLAMGGTNTVILITSSFTVALGYHAIKEGKAKKAVGFLVFTILCAAAFLVIKYFEYAH